MVTSRRKRWNNNPTKSITVPEIFLEEILAFARLLDQGKISGVGELEKLGEPKIVEPEPVEIKPERKEPKKASLTASQLTAFAQLQDFVSGRDKYFRLTGYAGTGKSFLICHLWRWLKSQKLKCIAASPTNKAAKNLTKIAQDMGVAIEVTTIAKLLGQQPEINQDTGKEEFIILLDVELDKYDIIILDEFSMISKEMFEEIHKAITTSLTKVIFVGDAAQLPPVGESEPIVATSNKISKAATLTEIVRYQGAIAKIAEEIRQNSRYNSSIYPFVTTQDNTIICEPSLEWLETALQHFQSQKFRQNSDYCRILVWRNKTADDLNNWVRRKMWGEDCPPYVVGDRLIARKPVFRASSDVNKKKRYQWVIVMNTSEECEVIGEPKLKNLREWTYWQVPVISDGGMKLTLNLLTPEAEIKRQTTMQELRAKKDWERAISLDKTYDYCPFAYALTTHKAQGSSMDYVFIDVRDMKYSRDLQKILYTALTRARIRAYLPI